MDHELILKYVGTLGFPICAAIGFAFALWKIGTRLLDSHMNFVNDVKAANAENAANMRSIDRRGGEMLVELQRQTAAIVAQTKILDAPICRHKDHA